MLRFKTLPLSWLCDLLYLLFSPVVVIGWLILSRFMTRDKYRRGFFQKLGSVERREGEWRIAHRRAVFDWNRDAPASETWCLGAFDTTHPDMVMGRKAPDDLTYQRG